MTSAERDKYRIRLKPRRTLAERWAEIMRSRMFVQLRCEIKQEDRKAKR